MFKINCYLKKANKQKNLETEQENEMQLKRANANDTLKNNKNKKSSLFKLALEFVIFFYYFLIIWLSASLCF